MITPDLCFKRLKNIMKIDKYNSMGTYTLCILSRIEKSLVMKKQSNSASKALFMIGFELIIF